MLYIISQIFHIALIFFLLIWLSIFCPYWVIAIILSFRSIVRSFALFILLSIAFSSASVSPNEFSNFSWFLFIVSSSFFTVICMTEQLHFHFSLSCIGEGNGNPLQYSCLENPRDGGTWWAAVSGVAQSRTRLKRPSSSSSSISNESPV